MTKEAAVNLSYLYAAELLKEAAEEEGVDLDAEAQNMSDEEVAGMLDEAVVDLANAGDLEPIFNEVDEDELDANASEPEGEEYESAEVDEELEAEAGLFIAKTAALLDRAGAAEEAGDALDRASDVFMKVAARRPQLANIPSELRSKLGGREGRANANERFAKGQARGKRIKTRIAKGEASFKKNPLSRAAKWFAGKGGKGVNKLRVAGAAGGTLAALGLAGAAGHAIANRRKNG